MSLVNTEKSIQDLVSRYVEQHFSGPKEERAKNLYKIVIDLIEYPLLQKILEHAGHNQCRATRYLGLARGTVIKKLKQHQLFRRKIQNIREVFGE